jgi:RNA polymerase sigma factor (sigma-70 family)
MQRVRPPNGASPDADPACRDGRVDAELAEVGRRLADNDPGAVADCYRLLGPGLAAYLRRYVPKSDVEDVLQRVFYEVWRSRSRYDAQLDLRAWVFGIARYRAIDHLRSPVGGAHVSEHSVVALDELREIGGEDGREVAERFAWADELRSAMGRLTEEQRQVIVMAFFEGYTQPEIAEILKIPLGTVKTRTFRALHRLAELLRAERGAS